MMNFSGYMISAWTGFFYFCILGGSNRDLFGKEPVWHCDFMEKISFLKLRKKMCFQIAAHKMATKLYFHFNRFTKRSIFKNHVFKMQLLKSLLSLIV